MLGEVSQDRLTSWFVLVVLTHLDLLMQVHPAPEGEGGSPAVTLISRACSGHALQLQLQVLKDIDNGLLLKITHLTFMKIIFLKLQWRLLWVEARQGLAKVGMIGSDLKHFLRRQHLLRESPARGWGGGRRHPKAEPEWLDLAGLRGSDNGSGCVQAAGLDVRASDTLHPEDQGAGSPASSSLRSPPHGRPPP